MAEQLTAGQERTLHLMAQFFAYVQRIFAANRRVEQITGRFNQSRAIADVRTIEAVSPVAQNRNL